MQALLQQLITSPQLLKEGDAILLQSLRSPDNRRQLLELFYACENRNYIVLAQNIYPQLWDSISSEEKEITRQALLKMLHEKYKQPRDIQALALFVVKLHNIEGYQPWSNLYQQLIQLGLTQHLLQFLLVVFRNQDDRIAIINPPLMQQIVCCLQNPSNSAALTQKLFILMYYVVRSSASLEGSNDKLFNSILGGANSSWLLGVYQTVLGSNQTHLHKLVLQQLTVIFSSAPKYAFSAFSGMVNLVWMYFNNLAPIYLQENVLSAGAQKPKSMYEEYVTGMRYDEETTLSQGLVYQGLQLMQSIFMNKSMKKLMRFGIYPLLSTMNSLLLITKRNEKEWLEEENKFIADTEDEDIIGVRNRIISFINLLVEDRYKGVIDVLKLIINNAFSSGTLSSLKDVLKQDILQKKIMNQLDEKILAKSEQLQQIFDKSFVDVQVDPSVIKETATLLLFSFAPNILSTIPDKNALFEILIAQVESSSYPLLKIQALNTLVRCAEQIAPQRIPSFLTYSLNSLESPYPGLRVISIKAIGVFCRKLRMSAIQTNHVLISQMSIQKIVSLVKSFSPQTIHVFLDTCIELIKFSKQTREAVIRHLQSLVPALIQTSMTDGLVAQQLVQLLGDASSEDIQHFLLTKLEQSLKIKGMQEVVQLCARILQTNLQNQIFKYQSAEQINQFIANNVKNCKLQSLIRQLIRYCSVSEDILNLCISNLRPSWFIPLHQRGITLNALPTLRQSIQSVINTLSPSEVEQELTLPFYLMWSNFQQTINAIKSFGCYDQFVSKWLRYQETFKGNVLRKVSLILSSKLQQPVYQQQVNAYIAREKDTFLREKELLSKLQPEWQDEENENQQQVQGIEHGLHLDQDGWMDGDLVNRVVEKQLMAAIKGIQSISIQEVMQNRVQ